MEFEDEHDEEEHEEEEEDEEDEITIPPPAVPPSYVDSVMGGVNSVPHRVSPVNHSPSTTETVSRRSSAAVRYRECLKNHAVGIGGHAVDGCGEFMPAGEEGTLDALKCAACNCHRNFHRKEVAAATDGVGVGEGGIRITVPPPPPPTVAVYSGYYRSGSTPNTPSGYLHMSPHIRPHVPALPSSNTSGGTHSGDVEMCDDMSHPSSSGGGRDSAGMITMSQKKRHRTKFTQEQKDKMLAFAEKLGWRIQKHDEAAVQHFCGEAQIKRQVLKVWMHNNKHTLGKKP